MTDDRTPPHDLDAERSVLGGIFLTPSVVDDVADLITGADFYRPAHETVFDAILGLRSRGEPLDVVTVADELGKRGDLARVGGALVLHDLMAATPTGVNAPWYARTVRQKATQRGLIAAGTRIAQLGYEGGEDVDATVEQARGEVDAISRTVATVSMAGDDIAAVLDSLEKPPTFIPTPWQELNDLIGGWSPGCLYGVGARPGVGKSILAQDAALGMQAEGVVSFSSLEMSRRDLQVRLIASLAEVNMKRLQTHTLAPEDWAKIGRHMPRLTSLRVAIDDNPSATLNRIRSHARSASRKGPLAGVIVDYLQLVTPSRADERKSRQEVVASFSRGLKILAKEMHVPVIALAQLNRGPEQRADRRPVLSDLKESGAIEQDCDVVLLLHEDESDASKLEVLVAKNRHGSKGVCELIRRGHYSTISGAPWTPSKVAS